VNKIDFMLTGVGGQGTLLASNVLAEVGMKAGYEVKKSEVHGMAQRGGSVVSHVRWGQVVHSPLIGQGEVDYFVAFEKLEALRHIDFLKLGGTAIINDHRITPISVSSGGDEYPDNERIERVLKEVTEDLHFVPGVALAEELGNVRASNVVLLGALSTFLDVSPDIWLEVIIDLVPERYRELNRQAFNRGRATLT
jgi:indolepyruvate ferredoxin oxidoreductase beta subunit